MRIRSIFKFLPPVLEYNQMDIPIEEFLTPSRVVILLKHPNGEPNVAVVEGDKVKTGQKLASNINSGVIASVTGAVKELATIFGARGETFTAVTIENQGNDEWDSSIVTDEDYLSKPPEELRNKLREFGWFLLPEDNPLPPFIKGDKKIDTVIVNAFDSEPIVAISQQLLRENSSDIQSGLVACKHVFESSRIILAVPENLQSIAKQIVPAGVTIFTLKPIYPNGLPNLLVHKIMGKEVPEGSTPEDIGILVIGVEKLLAMLSLLRDGKPQIEKFLTVAGKSIPSPRVFKVRIGTLVSDILSHCGVVLENKDRLIIGGPMRGTAYFSPDYPITEHSDAVIAQAAEEIIEVTDNPCVNCGDCVRVCPVRLQPHLLGRYSEFSLFAETRRYEIDACVECGLCAYVCAARRPTLQYIQFAKDMLRKEEETIE
ncbi:RnfABCDGE type electron transport complex subunit C [Candidatus Poribacteria bacterium]|nr:RnfABCDGE type electron transport complex subunit C [Candidatus Poribacteria bacterium]